MFVDFNILNQLGSPSINSNTFANRPSAGQVGRLFVSTDTFEIYRDNGTGWDLIGGPGSSTVTGSGAAGQVTYWTGTNSVGGENNLWWDAANNHFGINTSTPGVALDVHSAADVGVQFNGTGATPSILQAFQSAGVAQYEMGYNWNSDINYRRFSIYDSQGSKEVISIDQQSRYVGINYQYSSLADQPAYTFDVSGSGRFTDNAYFSTAALTKTYVGGTIGYGIDAKFNVQLAGSTTTPSNAIILGTDNTQLVTNAGYDLIFNFRNNIGFSSSKIRGTDIGHDGTNYRTELNFCTAFNISGIPNVVGRFTYDGKLVVGTTVSPDSNFTVQSGNARIFNALRINKNGSFFAASSSRGILEVDGTTDAIFALTVNNTNRSYIYYSTSLTQFITDNVFQIAAGGTTSLYCFNGNSRVYVGTSNSPTDNGSRLQVDGVVSTDGVKFPATQVPSTDVNTLDDYEEGTFTPDLGTGGDTSGFVYATRVGEYTKIGNLVNVRISIVLTTLGGSVGNAYIYSLPFTNGQNVRVAGTLIIFNTTATLTNPSFSIDGSANYGPFLQGNAVTAISKADLTNTTQIYINLNYRV